MPWAGILFGAIYLALVLFALGLLHLTRELLREGAAFLPGRENPGEPESETSLSHRSLSEQPRPARRPSQLPRAPRRAA